MARIQSRCPGTRKPSAFSLRSRSFDDYLASAETLQAPVEKLFQGPIADALTHVGQLAMLRRLAGCPIRAENYFAAVMEIGRVGADQALPKRTF